jgi:hypothetical protein
MKIIEKANLPFGKIGFFVMYRTHVIYFHLESSSIIQDSYPTMPPFVLP